MPTQLSVHGVTKRFGGTVALHDVHVDIERAQIHAIVGENGAGKSTLGKIIAGLLVPDAGSLAYQGETVEFRSPRAALEAGITMVAQELSLVPARTVWENVVLGIEAHRGPLISTGANRERVRRLSEDYGIHVPIDAITGTLSVADQQKVEILRSLARDADVIVMDEPTARLTSEEARALHESVRTLSSRGVTIVYVSHFLEEVLAIADVITIMRDGAIVRTNAASEETYDTLISGIIGRTLDAAFPTRLPPEADAPAVLELTDLARAGAFDDISFTVRAGEIVTLAGLVGSGRTEVARAVFGADQTSGGHMRLHGKTYSPKGPHHAIREGVAMVPESRKEDGLISQRNVRENLTLAHLGRFSSGIGLMRVAAERSAANEVVGQIGLTGATIESGMAELSGGNQQKSLFGRWMVEPPALFIADEPTRGVDVGAKRGIYQLIADLAAAGMAVLLVSSEMEEVLGMSHRVLVMRAGRIVGELDGASATEDQVMNLAMAEGAAA